MDEFELWITNALNNKHIQQFNYEIFEHPIDFAKGGFSKIKYAEWPYSNKKVALKKLNDYDIQKFVKEVKMHISCHWSEHVVQFFGLTKDVPEDNRYIMVMEYAELQSLQNFLKSGIIDENDWNIKYKLSLDIARGLNCLHSRDIIHCDLKNLFIKHIDNIVIKQIHRETEHCPPEYIAQITDFGEAISLNEDEIDTRGFFGKVEFVDPTHFNSTTRIRNEKSDIYSMGVIFWAISSGKMPFKNYMGDSQNRPLHLALAIMAGRREDVPDSTPEAYSQLYTTCWNGVPVQRPTLEQIIEILERLKLIDNNTQNTNESDNGSQSNSDYMNTDSESDVIVNEFEDDQNFDVNDLKLATALFRK